jgi:hypothetical protein
LSVSFEVVRDLECEFVWIVDIWEPFWLVLDELYLHFGLLRMSEITGVACFQYFSSDVRQPASERAAREIAITLIYFFISVNLYTFDWVFSFTDPIFIVQPSACDIHIGDFLIESGAGGCDTSLLDCHTRAATVENNSGADQGIDRLIVSVELH